MPLIKILHLRHVSGMGGGADSVLKNYLNYIPQTECQIHLWLFFNKSQKKPDQLMSEFKLMNLSIDCFQVKKYFDINFFIRLVKFCKKNKIQIIHSHDPKSNIYAYCLKKWLKIKIISTAHGWTHKTKKGSFYAFLDQKLLTYFDWVFAVSNSIKQNLLDAKITSVSVVLNAIDLNVWRYKSKTNDDQVFCVGYIGRLSDEKSPMDIIKIAQALYQKNKNYKFIVIGDGPLYLKMVQLIQINNLSECVIMLGALNTHQILDIMQKLDCLILTSRTEGLPMCLLEAMAMKIPVIASNVGGVQDLIKNLVTGISVGYGDIQAFVHSIEMIQKDTPLRNQMIECAYQLVSQKYSAKNNIQYWLQLYQKLSNINF